jgi:hypothetical protein
LSLSRGVAPRGAYDKKRPKNFRKRRLIAENAALYLAPILRPFTFHA